MTLCKQFNYLLITESYADAEEPCNTQQTQNIALEKASNRGITINDTQLQHSCCC